MPATPATPKQRDSPLGIPPPELRVSASRDGADKVLTTEPPSPVDCVGVAVRVGDGLGVNVAVGVGVGVNVAVGVGLGGGVIVAVCVGVRFAVLYLVDCVGCGLGVCCRVR